MGEGSGRGSGRVRLFVGNRGSGRVNVSRGRVGSKESDPWTTLRQELGVRSKLVPPLLRFFQLCYNPVNLTRDLVRQGHVNLTSKVKAIVLAYVPLSFLIRKIMEAKKFHRCSLHTTGKKKIPIQGHVTLTYKVTRRGYTVGLCCIELPDLENQENQQVHRFSLSTARNRCHVIGVMTSCCQILT